MSDELTLIQKIKNRKLTKKQREIEELKFEIEKAKLQKELDAIKGGKTDDEHNFKTF